MAKTTNWLPKLLARLSIMAGDFTAAERLVDHGEPDGGRLALEHVVPAAKRTEELWTLRRLGRTMDGRCGESRRVLGAISGERL